MGKNKYGQYFTKDVIASFMVDLIRHPHSCSVLEPSCGRGVFIDELRKAGYEDIVGYEVDQSLSTTYSCVKHESFISSPVSDKYDVIIGNPPYIRWKNLEDDLKKELNNCTLWKTYFNSLCDYLFIFILKSIEQLREEGELIFICSEYWLNTTNSLSLRNYMCKNGCISEIYHFKEAPLFEHVNASLIIFRYIKTKNKDSSINLYMYSGDGCPSSEELKTKACFQTSIIPQFKEGGRWILATESIQKELLMFEKSCSKPALLTQSFFTIGDFFDIANGMVSGLDKAFSVSDDEKKSLNELEKSVLIKVLKAKNLSRFYHSGFSEYIFIQDELTEKDFQDEYPSFYNHFEKYKEELNKRYNYNKDIPFWKFVFPRSQRLFEKPVDKIFVPCKERISNKEYVRFCYAKQDFFPLQDVTCIVPKKECKESIFYVLGYLNTPQVFNWLLHNGIIKGYIVEFSEKPISQIPFRKINWNKSKEVEIHNSITFKVKECIENRDSSIIQEINNLFNSLFYGE
ncbi:MAG: Eco57I restriction-modification methylase domain-containing protein [Paludibacteraceae bacterium]|nr:Eco57I restriction-modification methylase domain-containing protein [Paludibacteraceae bacterium]